MTKAACDLTCNVFAVLDAGGERSDGDADEDSNGADVGNDCDVARSSSSMCAAILRKPCYRGVAQTAVSSVSCLGCQAFFVLKFLTLR